MKGDSWRRLDDEAEYMRRYLPESRPHTRNLANELARVWDEDRWWVVRKLFTEDLDITLFYEMYHWVQKMRGSMAREGKNVVKTWQGFAVMGLTVRRRLSS